MLNFRNTNVIFLILLTAATGYHIAFDLHWLFFILLLFVYSLLLFYGSYFVGSQFYMKTICGAITKEKKIAITFDDGPLSNFTPKILNILKEQNVKATFFCIGKNATANIDLLKLIHAEGHCIGNHSYFHNFGYDLMSADKMKADIQQTHDLVQKEIGITLKWFRPPYGVTNPNLAKAVNAMGYTAIGWNVRSMDTIRKDEKKLLQKMTAQLKPGAIFLFHDTCESTAKMLPEFLQYVKEQQYVVTPLDKLLNLQSYV